MTVVVAATVALAMLATPDAMWSLEEFSAVPQVWPADGFESPDARAVYYAGPTYDGRPTRIFAWIGLPELAPGEKAPAMVLVHGGGGTAFDSWVKRWTDRGYAAIAMDTCGQVPRGEYGNWERNPDGGPAGWGGFDQMDRPVQDQWGYQAVAAVLLGHSLLASLPEVDADRIGLTGISWGGYLACILAGVDSRLKGVIPVYGTGHYVEPDGGSPIMGLLGEAGERWVELWDPKQYLSGANMPLHWVTGTNDFAFPLPGLQLSYRQANGPQTLSVRLRMPHGHGDAGEGPAEIFAFADSLLKGGEPLAQVYDASRQGLAVMARVRSVRPLKTVELCYTTASGPWPERLWETAPATLVGDTLRATLPAGVTCWFFNTYDDRDLCVSSEHEVITAPPAE